MQDELMKYRCECGKLLFKGRLMDCIIEVKCRRCHALVRWAETYNTEAIPPAARILLE